MQAVKVSKDILLTIYSLHTGSCSVTLILDVRSYCINVNTDNLKIDYAESMIAVHYLLFVLSLIKKQINVVHNWLLITSF
jgi:hypothetical protein